MAFCGVYRIFSGFRSACAWLGSGLYLLGAWFACPAFGQTATVTVSNQTLGRTPALIGYNLGHWLPDSNTADWWKHSGVNAARIFLSTSSIEPSDDMAPYGDGVIDLNTFNARRSALRADALNPIYINWSYFESQFASVRFNGNDFYAAGMLAAVRDLGAAPVAVLTRSASVYTWRDPGTVGGWQDRWEAWQQHYAMAFYLARYYNVQRFQMYNEVDHSSNAEVDQTSYLQRLQFASDAFQSAVLDVNTMFGKNLTPGVNAPVTAGGNNAYNANPGGDPRDDVTGWGELVIDNRHVNYAGAISPTFNLVHTYDYHRYNQSAAQQAYELTSLKTKVAADAPGEGIQMALSEFNVHTAAVFDTLTETLDTPSKSALLGAILARLIDTQIEELYIFKFSQTADSTYVNSGVKKNGCHFVANDMDPLNIGDATKGAEVVRLTSKLADNVLLNVPSITGPSASTMVVAAAREDDLSYYYLLSINQGTAPVTTTFNLTSWNLPVGTPIVVEEVDARWHGGITTLIPMPANRTLVLTHPGNSVLRLLIPSTPPTEEATLTASDDATVRPGANTGTNYGLSSDLLVSSNQNVPESRAVTALRFYLQAIDPATVRQAVLSVSGRNPGGSGVVIAHVYGINHDGWSEGGVNWGQIPNLDDAAGIIQNISDNFILDAGETATIEGHLSADATQTELRCDVTPFVRASTDRYLSFLITREVRFDGDVDDVNYMRIASRQDAAGSPPRLVLHLTQPVPTADADNDGDLDMSDFSGFQRCLTSDLATITSGCEAFDLTRDGHVSSLDVPDFAACLSGPNVSVNWSCLE